MNKQPILTALLASVLFVFSGLVQAATYKEGVDYELVAQPGKVEVPGKIEVREFFWYGCPHCYSLEAAVSSWKPSLNDDVNFIMTPAAMNKSWVNHAHAFYVAQALGKLDEISPELFKAIHVKKQKVSSQKDLAEFFTQFGVDEGKFNKLFKSFSVSTKVRQARTLSSNYRLRGVPALVVNGKYLVKTKSGTSYQELLKVVDYLVEKERLASKVALHP